MKSESKLQQECVEWFKNTYCLKHHNPQKIIFHVANEGQQKLIPIGLLPGVSDLIIVDVNRVIFVELKTETGIQSDKQKLFQNKVEALGHEYWLIRSLDDLKKHLNCVL